MHRGGLLRRPSRSLVEPTDEVAEDEVALRLVEDLVEEPVVLLELLVLARRVLEELPRGFRIGDRVGAAAQEQERSHELRRPAHHGLLAALDSVYQRGVAICW